MKSALWRRSVDRYVLPHLPGTWQVRGHLMYREPVDWILCCLALDNSRHSSKFGAVAVVQLLAIPFPHLSGPNLWELGHGTGRGHWEAPTTIEDAEPAMRDMLSLARAEALPRFDRLGTIDGYAQAAAERAANQPNDVNYQEQLFCIQLIHGDTDAALHTADTAHRTGHDDGRPWAIDVANRVTTTAAIARQNLEAAIEHLRSHADWTRQRLGLPPRPQP
jgi:hypothetical protein